MGKPSTEIMTHVTEKLLEQLTIHADGLDPIRVVIEQFGEGKQGMITITCYGRAWNAYWGTPGRSVREFFMSCDSQYLVGCLVCGMTPIAKHFVASDEAYLARIVTAVQQCFRTASKVENRLPEPAPEQRVDVVERITAPYYVLPREHGSSFVKEGDFFRSQGGLKDDWGKCWIPVCADTIEGARCLADTMVEKQSVRIYNSEAPNA
jgi:hypothetical protein